MIRGIHPYLSAALEDDYNPRAVAKGLFKQRARSLEKKTKKNRKGRLKRRDGVANVKRGREEREYV